MRIILALLLVSVLWSCSSNERPEGILSKEEMVPVLMDVYLTEGRLSSLSLKRDSALKVYEDIEAKIFEKNNTTDSIYRASMVYYYDHPKEMEKIYEVVLDSLTQREQLLDAKEESKMEEMKKKDEKPKDDEGKTNTEDTE